MDLRLTRPALQDFTEILEYVAAKSPQGARHVHGRFVQTFAQLQSFPQSGRLTTRDDDTRQVVVAALPFIVIYRLQTDTIEILRIRHTARNPQSIDY